LAQPKYFIFEEKGKLGLVDLQGKTVLAPTFNSIKEKQPYIIACKQAKGCSVYNENLQPILKGTYNSIRFGCEGQFIVEKNEKYGVVSEKGTIILPLKYSFINSNKNGYTVKLNGKVGLFNLEGKEIIPISYHWIYTDEIDDNILIVAELNGKEGYINTKNEWVIPPTYRDAFAFRQGLAKVMEVRDYIYINLKGEPVIQDFDADVIEPSDNTYIVGVRKKCKYMVYDLNGNLLDTYNLLRNNLSDDAIFAVKKGGKWGYIDGYGKVIIPLEYEYLKYDKSFGVFLVKKEQRYGFLDLEGNVRIPHIYTKIEKNALNGYFLELGDKVGYVKFLSIYSSANIFIPAIYSKIEKKSLHNKYILVYDGLTPLFVDGIGNQYKANVINMKKIEAFSESAEEKDGVKINNTIYYPDLSSKSNITKKEMLHPILEIAPK